MPVPLVSETVVCPVVVGRNAALDAIERALEQTARGRGQVVTLAGEAGIGKSRLIAETKARATRLGWTIVEGHCFETDRSLPYAPLLDLLHALFAGRSTEAILALLGAEQAALTPLLPELPAPPPAAVLAPEVEKRRLFNACCQFLTRLAAAQPLLLVIEDLHWSDDTSLELLLYCARQLVAQPILVLLSYRDEEVQPALEHLLAGLERQRLLHEVRLSRLAPSDVDTMLRAIFKLNRPVRAAFLDALFSLTEGNPFFIEEILRSLMASGEISADDEAWDSRQINTLHVPRSVQDAVRRRSQLLSPRARQVLTLAAVAGRRFQFPLLKDLAGCDEAELLALVREWIEAQLVVEESMEQFAFRHALTQRALYTALLARERRDLHAALAAAVERLYAGALEPHLAELAYHTYEAGAWEKALVYARRVGELAQAVHSPRAAAEQFTRAINAAQQLGRPPDPALYHARGQAYEVLGQFERAREDFERALQLARDTGDRLAEWQALTDLGFLWSGREYERAGSHFRAASELAQALSDPILYARSLNRLGNWLVNLGQAAAGLAAHREALAIFEGRRDQHGIAETLDLLGMASGIYGDITASVRYLDAAIARARALGDEALLGSSLTTRVVFNCPGTAETTAGSLGTPVQAQDDTAEALALARRLDSPAAQAYAHFTACIAYASFGEFGAGLASGHEAVRIASEIGHRQWIAGSRCWLGQAYALLPQPTAAIEQLEAALLVARELGSAWWTGNSAAFLAFAYVLDRQLDRAEAVLQAAMPAEQEPHNAPERRLLWAWGRLQLAKGEAEAALQTVERLLNSAPGEPAQQAIPALHLLQGEALLALGRTDEAEAALNAAQQGAQERGDRPHFWQIQHALAGIYERTGRAAEAQQAAAAARETLAALAATVADPALRAQMLAALPGAWPQPPTGRSHRLALAGPGGLTAREREIAGLVARGLANRAIAEALVIGERTVETHISNILAKLGCTTRTEIAAWAVQQGLTAASG